MRFPDRFFLALGIAGALLLASAGAYIGFVALDAGDDPRAFRNVSGAMERTLLIGDYVTVRRLPPAGLVARGDVVVHAYPPDPSKEFVKRVVGLSGDTLAMRGGTLFVDGHAAVEPYAWHSDPGGATTSDDFAWERDYLAASTPPVTYRASRDDWGPIVVPADSYFVLGDNRDNSLDSRYWGFVARTQIVGRVRRVYFSRDPSTGDVRWSRFGRALP